MKKETNLSLFIESKGLTHKQLFYKIRPFIKRWKKRSFHAGAMSSIVSGKLVPHAKEIYDGIQQAFNLNNEEIEKLKDTDHKIKNNVLESITPVYAEDLETLLAIQKVTKGKFTLGFAIKTLIELSKEN